jgi:signal transduction histidine kinase
MIKKIFIIALAIWVLIVSCSAYYNIDSINKQTETIAIENARSLFRQIIVARKWNSDHGGVYVFVDENNQPNPYLDDPKKNITTTDGSIYTKINPAYMTRQMSEIAQQYNKMLYHITSLNPIRPANQADDWEKGALATFEKGNKEVFELVPYQSEYKYRFMAPLMVDKSCLQCHMKQGYQEGDVRGGISVSIDSKPYIDARNKHLINISIVHIFVFFIGITGIIWFRAFSIIQFETIQNKNKELSDEIQERIKAQNITDELFSKLLDSNIQIDEDAKEMKYLNEQLIETTTELRKLNSTKDKFFSIIAHDLRNPLGSFMAITDELANGYSNYSDADKRKYLELIKVSSKSIYNLLENLLTWSRSQGNTIPFAPQYINLKLLTDLVIESIRVIAVNKNIELINNIHVDEEAFCDYNMVSTVVRNLISNSLKFTYPNGKIIVSSYSNTIDFVRISVLDTGIGMSQETIDKLFQIDVRHDTLGTLSEKGTGLGLILCYDFILKHNGKIWVESEKGKGSTFHFTIPKKETQVIPL